ncbi:MAG: alkaline phosphatase family protein [Chlamydiota bacterium]
MINEESIQAVNGSCFSTRFRKPLYDSFCFSKIPATISYLLTGEGKSAALPRSCFNQEEYDGVILLFIDAFGWCFLEKYLSHPFLQRCLDKGILSKVTSQFPSTTAAHVTTIHTGLEVGETGIYEWFQYEPKVDRVIAPLLFSYAGDGMPSSLIASGIPPEEFFPFTTLYQKLHLKGVDSFIFQESSINESPYSQSLSKGAHSIGYLNLMQGLKSLSELFLSSRSKKTYAFFYHSHIDSVGHRKGVEHKTFEKSILYCLDLLEKELAPLMRSSKKLALLLTADHGMVPVCPKKTIYINQEMPYLVDWLQVKTPAGSCRDLFLTVKKEYLERAIQEMSILLQGKAEVWKVETLIQKGFFGKASQRFLERVGNLVIVPYEGESVWWFEHHKFKQNFYGSHGGLTPHEMETSFLFLPLTP